MTSHQKSVRWMLTFSMQSMQTLTVQRDTDLSTVSRLEFISVDLDGVRVCYEDTVSDDPRFPARISHRTLGSVTGMTRGEGADAVSQDGTAKRFVESDPVLDPGPQSLKHDARVVGKIGHEFVLVQKPPVPLVQFVREVPVEERHERSDAGGQ